MNLTLAIFYAFSNHPVICRKLKTHLVQDSVTLYHKKQEMLSLLFLFPLSLS